MKLNNADNYEHLCNVVLSKDKFPIAFSEKVSELVEFGISEDEAEKMVSSMEIELELYYHKGFGLFAVESDAVESSGEIHSPYDGSICENYD